MARISSLEVVGREGEREALVTAARRAAGGDAGFVFVTGEAGIGKTRLVRDLAARGRDDGWSVRWGECVPSVAGELPYAPVFAALREDLGELPGPSPPARAQVFE